MTPIGECEVILAGPPGDDGPQGIQGEPGPQGPPGDDGASFGNPDTFGAFAQIERVDAPENFANGVFNNYLTLTTPVIPAGDYRVAWSARHGASTASTEGEVEVAVDGGAALVLEQLTVSSSGEKKSYSDFDHVTLAAGAHVITMDARRYSGSGNFTLHKARLEIWRVA